jgi:hypothetical protein
MLISIEEKDNLVESVYDSSNIVASRYIAEAEILYIVFKKNKVYSYTPVSQELFQEFQLANSQGKFFIDNIKKNDLISCIKEETLDNDYYILLEQKVTINSDNS